MRLALAVFALAAVAACGTEPPGGTTASAGAAPAAGPGTGAGAGASAGTATATAIRTAAAATKPSRLNFVIVLLDTVRPDRLGAYGYGRPTSPNFDRFAAGSILFERVWAHAPNTPRSFPSILTGLTPSRIAFVRRFANFSDILPSNETLFEIFRAGGWRTEAVSSHWYFDLAPGVKDGVDRWDNAGALDVAASATQSAAPDITPRVVARLEALAATGAPFLFFAHYFDPHGRYMEHPDVRSFGPEIADRYDGEIAFLDHHLAPVLAALERAPLRDRTVVVLFSDHGEALGEHGLWLHGRTLYEEELRVPLAIRVPGAAPRRVADRAALIDLLPTLAELAGLAAPNSTGASLVPLLDGRAAALPARTLFFEQLPYPAHDVHLAAALGPTGTKLVYEARTKRVEAYDLAADPGEKKNLFAADPDAAPAERAALKRFLAEDPEGAGAALGGKD